MITDDQVMRLFERADPARVKDPAPVIDAAGYLDTLQTRSIDVTLTKTPPTPTGPTRRHRWRIITAAAAAVVLIAGGALVLATRDDPADPVTTDPTSTTEATAPTTGRGNAPDPRAWPDPDGGVLFTDPVQAARSFVTLMTGVADPPLSEFQSNGPGMGTVDVFELSEDGQQWPGEPARADRPPPYESRVASTIVLRQVGEHWFVSTARSHDVELVEISAPVPGAQDVTWPVTVRGSGRGTIAVQLRTRTAGAEVLAEDVATGGSGPSPEPFTVELSLDAARMGFVFAADTSDASGPIPSFAVMPGLPPGDPSDDPGDLP